MKLLALIFVFGLITWASVGTMWYAYGIPLQNAPALILFSIVQLVLGSLLSTISND